MRQKYFLFSIFFMQTIWLGAQVGINNTNPAATLDVSGDVLVREKLFLEEPGKYTGSTFAKLLMVHENGSLIHYDIESSSYGPLNYVQFVFRNTSYNGLSGGYNTKISASLYTLAVHGFYFVRTGDGNANITLKSNRPNGTRFVEGQQFYAYVDGPSHNRTWWIKGLVNNSSFYLGNSIAYIDIYMDVLIYRNNFMTKNKSTPLDIDMKKQPTAIAPLPAGF